MTKEEVHAERESTRSIIERELAKAETVMLGSVEKQNTLRRTFVNVCGNELSAWLKARGLVLRSVVSLDGASAEIELALCPVAGLQLPEATWVV